MKQCKSINIKELSKKFLIQESYKYALVYYLNDLYFGDIKDMEEINEDILVEGFFFNESKELHFFEDNGFCGIVTEGQEEGFEEEFLLKKKLGNNLSSGKYKKIKVYNYVEYEEDGQAYIKYTALKGVR